MKILKLPERDGDQKVLPLEIINQKILPLKIINQKVLINRKVLRLTRTKKRGGKLKKKSSRTLFFTLENPLLIFQPLFDFLPSEFFFPF